MRRRPGQVSTFTHHLTNAAAAGKRSFLTARRADAGLRAAMDSWRRSGVPTERISPSAIWEELLTWLTSYFDAKAAFDQNPNGAVPWVLNPPAWRNRIQRERSIKQLHRLKMATLSAGPD